LRKVVEAVKLKRVILSGNISFMAENSNNRIFLFHGSDDYTSSQKIKQWLGAFRSKYSGLGVTSINAQTDEGALADFFENQSQSAGLFSSTRLVILKNFLQLKAGETEKLQPLLKNPPADLFLILWEDKSVKKTLKLYKLLTELERSGKAKIYSFDIPTGSSLNEFISKYFKSHGTQISSAAIELLAQFFGRDLSTGWGAASDPVYNLWEVSSTLDKLATYKQGSTIEAEDVRQMVTPKVSENVFAFTEALGRKDYKLARKTLEELLSKEETSSDIKSKILGILGAVSFQFRSLLMLSVARQAGQTADLGWNSYRLQANERLLQHFSPSALRDKINTLSYIDRMLKSSSLSERALLDRLWE